MRSAQERNTILQQVRTTARVQPGGWHQQRSATRRSAKWNS